MSQGLYFGHKNQILISCCWNTRSEVPLDVHDLRQPLHGPGGVLAVHVPEQGPGLGAGLQPREDRVRVLLPGPGLAFATTVKIIRNNKNNNNKNNSYLRLERANSPTMTGALCLFWKSRIFDRSES